MMRAKVNFNLFIVERAQGARDETRINFVAAAAERASVSAKTREEAKRESSLVDENKLDEALSCTRIARNR